MLKNNDKNYIYIVLFFSQITSQYDKNHVIYTYSKSCPHFVDIKATNENKSLQLANYHQE